MKRSITFWMIAIVFFFLAQAFGKDNPEATTKYKKALEQLKAGNLNIDFKALRLNCSDSKYSCEADSEDKRDVTVYFNIDIPMKRLSDALKR